MARIGIDARYLETEDTGLGRYSLNLLTHLLELDREHGYWVFLREGYAGGLPSGPNASYVRVPYPPISLSSLVTMSWRVRRLRLDLWHAHFPVVPLFCGVPLVVTVHDLQPLRVPALGGRRPLPLRVAYRLYYPLVYRASLTLAREIVAVSGSTCVEIQELLSVPREKIHMIREAPAAGLHSVHPKRPTQAKGGAVAAGQLNLPERFLLSVGPALPHKNLEGLLHGFAKALQQPGTEDFFLVMAGRETRFDKVWKGLGDRLGISPRIRRIGYVPREVLGEVYDRALALIHLSRYEGFGFPLLEAMQHGLPVIAAAHAALPEVAGSAALFVDPGDVDGIARAIVRIAADEPLRRRLAHCGRLNLERFDWRQTAAQTLRLYEGILRDRSLSR